MRSRPVYLFFSCLALALASCGKRPNADVEDIDLKWDFARVDTRMSEAAKALNTGKADTFRVYLQYIKPERAFFEEMTGALDRFRGQNISEGFKDTVVFSQLIPLLADKQVAGLLDTIQQVFPKGYDFEGRLLPPLKRLHKYFPDLTLPKFRTFGNGYIPDGDIRSADQMVPTPDNGYFGIGLHYFLGHDLSFYPPGIPMYLRRRFDKDYLDVMMVREMSDGLVQPVSPAKQPTLLDYAVREGIRLYLIDQLLPETQDSLKICYSSKQMGWAKLYEKNIYKELTPQLYSSDALDNQKFLGEKPYTTQLSQESAPRIAQYFGWQVVRAYMKQFPDTKLPALCERTDYEAIFKASKYKP